jgi:hypothetical protein
VEVGTVSKIKQLINGWLDREPGIKDRNRLQQLSVKALVGFFTFIILLAILSRATQAFTIPNVQITAISEGNLIFNIAGEGSLEASDAKYIQLPEGIRVSSVFVSEGTYVEEGTPLLMLNPDDISMQLSEEQNRLSEIELQRDIERLSGNSEELTRLKIESLQPEYDKIKEKIDSLQGLFDDNGIIKSSVIGRINVIDAVLGQRIQNGDEIVVGTSGFLLHASMQEDDGKLLNVGDELSVSRPGRNDRFFAEITNITYTNDNMVEFYAKLGADKQYTSSSLVFTLQKVSSKFENCVPLTVLRQDAKGTFVYILVEADSLLGKEYHVKRIDVKVLDHDVATAVIEEGRISYKDRIIISSDKIIGDGDKVRIKD